MTLFHNNLSEVQKPYRIQVDDILNIRIKVLDQDNTFRFLILLVRKI
jgi:hypothetical protein